MANERREPGSQPPLRKREWHEQHAGRSEHHRKRLQCPERPPPKRHTDRDRAAQRMRELRDDEIPAYEALGRQILQSEEAQKVLEQMKGAAPVVTRDPHA